jgi:myosin heavy subunit
MAERTIVWVQEDLIALSLGVTSKHAGSRGQFRWVRCSLLGGSVTDPELSIEVAVATDDFQLGQRAVVKAKAGAVLMGNDFEKPPSDLITLTHLHEPAVVFSLQKRYESDIIYTSTGPMLLALNPFKPLPFLYEDDTMIKYWRYGEGIDTVPCDPHVYGNADKAFRQMLAGIEFNIGNPVVRDDPDDSSAKTIKADQSMLVSGESGAGKTVTTKHIMKYLASLSERKAEHDKRRRAPSPGRGDKEAPRRNQSLRLSRGLSWKTGTQIEEKSRFSW